MQSSNDELLPRPFLGGALRRLRPDDLATFQTYRAIPELGRYQGWTPMAEADALAFLTRMNLAPLFSPGNWIQLGIAAPVTDQLIGDIGLFVAADERTAEIGFTLEPNSQGRGIATAAVREALHLLVTATKVEQVLGITDARNRASHRLLKRVGFQWQENRDILFRGAPCSEKIYCYRRRDDDSDATVTA
jgi:RimJ/RimL family protein N-acetyltransferase